MASSSACTQAIWMDQLFEDLGVAPPLPIPIHYDNTNTIAMTKNLMSHSKSKHIEIQHHFMQDVVIDGYMKFTFCKSEYQLIDIFTKALSKDRFLSI